MQKWGNSFAVRIPRAAVRESGLREGEPLEIEASARQLRLRRASRRHYSLDDLVAAIRRGNRHAEEEFGAPQGREAF